MVLRPVEDAESWARKYDLVIKEKKCENCQQFFLTNVPMAIKDWRGLCMPEHGCPRKYLESYWAPIKPMSTRELEEGLKFIKQELRREEPCKQDLN